jgi:hypothetical protein
MQSWLRFFSHSVGFLLILVVDPFAVQKLFVLCGPICQPFLLLAELLEFCCLRLFVPVLSLLFPMVVLGRQLQNDLAVVGSLAERLTTSSQQSKPGR